MKRFKFIFCIAIFLFTGFHAAGQQKGYYRYPAIHGNDVIFTAEGDLWRYSLDTKQVYRITTSHGVESHASISPDGRWIAFIGQYEGPSEVYTMPFAGGRPKRLTYEEGSPVVYQWTAENKVLYSTSSQSTLPNAQLIKINPDDLSSETIPLSQADQGTYSPEGDLFFTRLRDQGSHTKRYKGGTAQSLWKFDGKNEARPLTSDYPGTSKNPMYYDGRIYFLTDRDGTMNIWSMNTSGADLKQHTKSVRWDLQDGDLDGGKIVCQQGADILLYDIKSDKSEILDISLTSDFDQRRVQWINDPKSKITSIGLSEKGDYIVITSRGRVFSMPVEGGDRWAEVTRKYGIRYKSAVYANGGNEITMLSDESGEFEVWKTDNFGFDPPVQVTTGSKDFIENFSVSPDGNYVVFNEKDKRLKLWSKTEGTSKVIAQNNFGYQGPFSWSSDSRWIAFTDAADNQTGFIRLYDARTGLFYQVTTDRQDSYTPRFSRDGKWLYFISDRTFSTLVRSPWGSKQPEPYYEKTARIYAVALNSAAAFPFTEPNELNPAKPDSAKNESVNADQRKSEKKKSDSGKDDSSKKP
ncbi:MAG: protease, partial [Bacteroidota bacterium]|nr:protease [Bacteroidota bacterium]